MQLQIYDVKTIRDHSIVERILEGQIIRDMPIKSHLLILCRVTQPCEWNTTRITWLLPVPPSYFILYLSRFHSLPPSSGAWTLYSIMKYRQRRSIVLYTHALAHTPTRAQSSDEPIFHSQMGTNVPIMRRGIKSKAWSTSDRSSISIWTLSSREAPGRIPYEQTTLTKHSFALSVLFSVCPSLSLRCLPR